LQLVSEVSSDCSGFILSVKQPDKDTKTLHSVGNCLPNGKEPQERLEFSATPLSEVQISEVTLMCLSYLKTPSVPMTM
jgi:hypothetical protein